MKAVVTGRYPMARSLSPSKWRLGGPHRMPLRAVHCSRGRQTLRLGLRWAGELQHPCCCLQTAPRPPRGSDTGAAGSGSRAGAEKSSAEVRAGDRPPGWVSEPGLQPRQGRQPCSAKPESAAPSWAWFQVDPPLHRAGSLTGAVLPSLPGLRFS
ncbi:hypothetical protein KIL84_002521 [Mauremys mutica]|uniref:Uncharacterized protein n=1 Tax=Mauremys mutica TaxID=74926 RepID=A0A9D3X7P9_9SAUR|nr:hypothetical protein KIL84_002521 [Mauremys mutica]